MSTCLCLQFVGFFHYVMHVLRPPRSSNREVQRKMNKESRIGKEESRRMASNDFFYFVAGLSPSVLTSLPDIS